MENEPTNIFSDAKREDSINFIRHSNAGYTTYKKVLRSDNPTAEFRKEEQVTPDLTEEGIELARQEAEKLFESLNSNNDILFFASSNEARAVETAYIYHKVAKEQGFQIIKPEHSRSMLSEEMSGGEIRVINELSIDSKNMLLDFLFVSPDKRGDINWAVVDPEFKVRFDQASKIIEDDDQGSYGGNLQKHGEKVKEVFPEITTAQDHFNMKFKNLKRLAKFGFNKAEQSGQAKNIKILAFGHEGYVAQAIQNHFQEEGIDNCETIQVTMNIGSLIGNFRGKEAQL